MIFIILYQRIRKSQQNNETNKSVSFNAHTSSSVNHKDTSKWEIVYRETERWNELGLLGDDCFPGYGRLYDREFKVWYCDVGSKEVKDEKIIRDKSVLHYNPINNEVITGEGVYLEGLVNTKGYESLYTGLDKKNKKRWYFALVKSTPTWIETNRAIEKEEAEIKHEEIEVPQGWNLVRYHSEEWKALGYENIFPGYGKIHEVTFDIWYCNVGSKEKNNLTELKAELALGYDDKLYFLERAYKQINELKAVHLNFERLSRSQGYSQLYSGLDNSNKRRWYLGAKEMKPSYYYTASAK